jgi:hypothetical protein
MPDVGDNLTHLAVPNPEAPTTAGSRPEVIDQSEVPAPESTDGLLQQCSLQDTLFCRTQPDLHGDSPGCGIPLKEDEDNQTGNGWDWQQQTSQLKEQQKDARQLAEGGHEPQKVPLSELKPVPAPKKGSQTSNGHHTDGHQPAPPGHTALQWTPQAYEQLLLATTGGALPDFTLRGILRPFNGICNDLRFQVDGLRALQDRLAQFYDEARFRNGSKGSQDGPRQRPALHLLNALPPPNASTQLPEELASSHRSLNGRRPANARRPRPPSVSGGAKKTSRRGDDVVGTNGSTVLKAAVPNVSVPKALEDPKERPLGLWPPKLNHPVRFLPPDLEMQGIVHPHRLPLRTPNDNGEGESDGEGPLLNDPPLERRDPSPPLNVSAVHAPSQPKGFDIKVESQPWWSEEAFGGLSLNIDPAILSLQLTDFVAALQDGPKVEVSVADLAADADLQQQLLETQGLLRDLMRENADMRNQIEESDAKEKRWRVEKQRLNKEILFQRTSISTLQCTNAHLQHEVDELRALGDTLLSHIKQKMKHGLHAKPIGVGPP